MNNKAFKKDERLWSKTDKERAQLKKAKARCSDKDYKFSSQDSGGKMKKYFTVRIHKGNETSNLKVNEFELGVLKNYEKKGKIRIGGIYNEGLR